MKSAHAQSSFSALLMLVGGATVLLFVIVLAPVWVHAQLRGEDRPGPAPGRPDDRPALTAPERARSAEVSDAPGMHFAGEGYASVFGGLTIGHEFNEARATGGTNTGAQLGDRNLLNSGIYGGKLGYFLPGRMDWLGFEVEGFTSTPGIEQTGSQPGSNLRVNTLAANVIARTWLACGTRRDTDTVRRDGRRDRGMSSSDLPFCRVQPYAGIGLGAFFARERVGGVDRNDSAPGLNFLAGIRYYFTDNLALYGEYKFNYASFNFTNPDVSAGMRGDYTASHVVAGVSFHY